MSTLSKYFLLTMGCLILTDTLFAQQYELGVSYSDENNYIEYVHGNLPLIISVPHGGDLKPVDISDRDCDNCVYSKDSFTQELGRSVADAIFESSGCVPHLIINKLHRSKMDANRAIGNAADGDLISEAAWEAYHDFINVARDSLTAHYQKGLFLDLHGHGHTVQRLELGYLLSKSNLQLDDEDLDEDSFVEKSSIKNLINDTALSLSELVRGENSFGHEISNRGYPSVPSSSDPFPDDGEDYFSGGYNTAQYGSRDGGIIDAIQIECNQDVRFQTNQREAFAESLAIAIMEFQIRHYDTEELPQNCFILNTQEESQEPFLIAPNPTSEFFQINYGLTNYKVSLYNLYGQRLLDFENVLQNYSVSDLAPGTYTVVLQDAGHMLTQRLVIIR